MSQQRFVRHLSRFLTKNQVLILSGPQMIGKRFLSEQIAKQFRRKILVLDLAKTVNRKKLVNPDFFLSAHASDFIVLENLEYFPALLVDIIRFQGVHKKLPKIVLTLNFQFDAVFRFYAIPRKVIVQEIFSISFQEATRLKSVTIFDHWLKGAYPGFLTAPSHRVLNNRMDRIIESVCTGNTAQITGHQLSRDRLMELLEILAQLNGTILNIQAIGKSMALSGPTVLRYINYLEAAMLIRLLPAYSQAGASKRVVKAPKIYFRDCGLLHHLRSIKTVQSLSKSIGQADSWEAYCIDEITKVLPPKYKLRYYRTQHAAEIQLVLTKNNKHHPALQQAVVAISIQSGPSPQLPRGLRNCFADLSTRKNYILPGPGQHAHSIPPEFPAEFATSLKSVNCSVISLAELLLKLPYLRF